MHAEIKPQAEHCQRRVMCALQAYCAGLATHALRKRNPAAASRTAATSLPARHLRCLHVAMIYKSNRVWAM